MAIEDTAFAVMSAMAIWSVSSIVDNEDLAMRLSGQTQREAVS